VGNDKVFQTWVVTIREGWLAHVFRRRVTSGRVHVLCRTGNRRNSDVGHWSSRCCGVSSGLCGPGWGLHYPLAGSARTSLSRPHCHADRRLPSLDADGHVLRLRKDMGLRVVGARHAGPFPVPEGEAALVRGNGFRAGADLLFPAGGESQDQSRAICRQARGGDN